MIRHLFENPIRAFALICVAVDSCFFGYLSVWLIHIISSPAWCAKAIQAERITPGSTFTGLTACIDLLKMQVASIAQALLIVLGAQALSLIVLVVIVIAGARLSAKVFGQNIDIDRSGAARVVVENPPSAPIPTAPVLPVPPPPTGPAMPEPPRAPTF